MSPQMAQTSQHPNHPRNNNHIQLLPPSSTAALDTAICRDPLTPIFTTSSAPNKHQPFLIPRTHTPFHNYLRLSSSSAAWFYAHHRSSLAPLVILPSTNNNPRNLRLGVLTLPSSTSALLPHYCSQGLLLTSHVPPISLNCSLPRPRLVIVTTPSSSSTSPPTRLYSLSLHRPTSHTHSSLHIRQLIFPLVLIHFYASRSLLRYTQPDHTRSHAVIDLELNSPLRPSERNALL